MLKLGGPALEGPDETLLQHQKTRETVLSVGLSIGSLHGLKHAQNNNICYYQSLSPCRTTYQCTAGLEIRAHDLHRSPPPGLASDCDR